MPFQAPRITGGIAKSIRLKAPKTYAIRPTTDAMRQRVFSSIHDFIEGAHFLDVYAGTGAYGLEALSRGAQSGVFVEKNAQCATYLKENVIAVAKSCGKDAAQCPIFNQDLFSFKTDQTFDLVFVDPPFAEFEAEGFFDKLLQLTTPWVKHEGLLLIEMPSWCSVPERWNEWHLVKRIGQRTRQKPSVAIYALSH